MSLSEKVFASSYFLIMINMLQRVIGIVSVLILARLLAPGDFGVIAVLAVTINLVDTLSDAGSQQYIIQKENVDRQDLNTAWSIDIVGKMLLTIALWLAAPYIADILENPLLSDAIRVVSLTVILRAFRNPGLMLLAKNLEYHRLFKLFVWQKLLSFAAVMAVVMISPSYWAIVVGDITSALILLIGSYAVHEFKPQFTLIKIAQQWAFSQWALLRGFTGFLRAQADIMIVSKAFTPADLGAYHLQRELALIPVFSLVLPALEPLLAAISNAKHDAKLLVYRMRLSMLFLLIFLLPFSLFIYLYSELIVSVLLGKQWIEHHQYLKYFSLMFFTFAFHALLSDCFVARGDIKTLFFFDLLSTLFVIALLLLFLDASLEDFVLIRGLIGLVVTGSLLLLLDILFDVGLLKLLRNALPTLLASLITLFIVPWLILDFIMTLPAFIELIITTIMFFTCYAMAFLLCSHLAKGHLSENDQVIIAIENLFKRVLLRFTASGVRK